MPDAAELPVELGHGSGWTCWRRMHEWADAGVFDRLHRAVLDRLGERDRLRRRPARQPIRRTLPRRHAGHRARRPRTPAPRPLTQHGDKGYDNPRVRRYLRRRGITARIARIGRDSSARLGRHRWVVERTLGWLLSSTRLALRYDRTATTISALARLAVTLICARRLPTNEGNIFPGVHRWRARMLAPVVAAGGAVAVGADAPTPTVQDAHASNAWVPEPVSVSGSLGDTVEPVAADATTEQFPRCTLERDQGEAVTMLGEQLIPLIVGFFLTTVLGGGLGFYFQRRAWAHQHAVVREEQERESRPGVELNAVAILIYQFHLDMIRAIQAGKVGWLVAENRPARR